MAEHDEKRVGLLTFAVRDDGLEVVTIQSLLEGRGIGRALMNRIHDHGLDAGAKRMWLTTTNDNVRAIGFYQHWGMNLIRLIPDGVAVSRRVKPSIPLIAGGGIPMRHELEFELRLS